MLSLSLMLRYEKVMFASGTPVLLAVKLPTISILPFEESEFFALKKAREATGSLVGGGGGSTEDVPYPDA